ncbi:hypothetical protein GE061_009724 [Apolygus lucorum]|uniref:Uncharacterized protein n=1 Tax=Apolygus lucorum TaxID=248454 RepID=A0A6A4KHU8_APOLU|nr:hypothetical protein GE061_009724 [Apolygus lucorum]
MDDLLELVPDENPPVDQAGDHPPELNPNDDDDIFPLLNFLEILEENQLTLEEATEKGDIETLLRILEDEGHNLIDLVPNCHKLLIDALQRGYFDIATLLVSKGAPVNCSSESGWTPLHIAAGDAAAYEVIKLMLERGAHANAEIAVNSVTDYLSEEAGDTPLHRAALKGNLKIVELLLEHGADCNKTNTHVTPPLIVAVKGKWKEITKILLDHGADVHQYNINPPSLWCLTPLDWAMSQLFVVLGPDNLYKVVHYFLSWAPKDISAAIEVIPKEVELPESEMEGLLDLLEIIELLVMKGASDNIIIQAMKFRYPEEAYEVAVILLNHGAKMEVEDQRGISLMQVAACVGCHKLIKLFLDHGAEVDRPNHCGWTPLMISLAGFRLVDLDVVKLFIEYGANVNAEDDKGKTLLMIAIPGYTSSPNHCNLIEYLLDQGASINKADSDGDTPLSRALRFRKRDDDDDIIKLLLDRGAEVDTVNSEGNSPLHIAISKYDRVGFKVIKMLLDHGAEVDAKDAEGNTPLMLAISCCYFSDVAQLLIDHGADINARNSHGHTPFQLAVIESRTDIISQLLVNKVQFDPKDLLEDESLVRLVIGTVPYRRREVFGIRRLNHRNDILEARKELINNYIQQHHAERDSKFRGRVYLALSEGLRNSPTEIKCITGLGSSALLFTIVESRVLDLKLKMDPVPNSHLTSVLSYRIKYEGHLINMRKTYNMMCNKEIRRMKLYRISDTVTLHDVITKEPKQAAAYARSENVQRQLLKLYHRNKIEEGVRLQFPIFGFLINNRIQNALARLKLVNAGEYCLNSLFHRSIENERRQVVMSFDVSKPSTSKSTEHWEGNTRCTSQQPLPIVVTDVILNLLEDEDLQNLIAADCDIESESIKLLHAEWREELLTMIYNHDEL